MCLAVTGKVISIGDGEGEVVIDGRVRLVSFIALPDAKPGDYVLVSLGMAMEQITEAEAMEINSAWDEIARIGESSEKQMESEHE